MTDTPKAPGAGFTSNHMHDLAVVIWDAMTWANNQPSPPHGAAQPSYTKGGNSFAEDKARATAWRILFALEPAPDAAIRAAALEEAANAQGWEAFVKDDAPMYLSDWQRGLVAGQNAVRAAIRALIEKGPTT